MSRPQYARLACALLPLGAPALAQNQRSRECEALQTFFDRLVSERHRQLFRGLNTVAQWEPRKRDIRASLERMLWFDLPWTPTAPPAQITHRAGFGDYLLENLVVETAPGLFLTAKLYLPRAGKPPTRWCFTSARMPARASVRVMATGLPATALPRW